MAKSDAEIQAALAKIGQAGNPYLTKVMKGGAGVTFKAAGKVTKSFVKESAKLGVVAATGGAGAAAYAASLAGQAGVPVKQLQTGVNLLSGGIPSMADPKTFIASAAKAGVGLVTQAGAAALGSALGSGPSGSPMALSLGNTGGGIYEGIDRILGGILPGGSPLGWGNNNLPATTGGGGILSGQIPIMTNVIEKRITVAPPGYVKVRRPDGKEVAVLKPVAYATGMRKRPTTGGGISGSEIRAAEKVNRKLMKLTKGRVPKSPLKTGKKR